MNVDVSAPRVSPVAGYSEYWILEYVLEYSSTLLNSTKYYWNACGMRAHECGRVRTGKRTRRCTGIATLKK